MADTAGRFVAAQLAARGWTQQDLVREAGINKNTVSGFLTGATTPSRKTLGRIERALGLTPGTLEAIGEEPATPNPNPSQVLAEVTDEELLAELTYRITKARKDLAAAKATNQTVTGADAVTVAVDELDSRRQRIIEQGQPADVAAYRGEHQWVHPDGEES